MTCQGVFGPRASRTQSAMALMLASSSFRPGTMLDTTSTWQPCFSWARTAAAKAGAGSLTLVSLAQPSAVAALRSNLKASTTGPT